MNKQKKTRQYGEGSIYQRKDGRWVAKYKSEEMLKPCVLYGKTETEVKRKLREFKKEAALGVVERKRMRFAPYAERWFYTFKQHSVESSTFDRYESIYLNHIKPVFGSKQLSAIRGIEIQKLLISKSDEFSYNLVKKMRLIFAEIFDYARSEGDIAKNPMRNVKMPKKALFKPEREIVSLEDAEVREIERVAELTYLNGTPLITHANALVFLIHTGLRCGELQALEWSDIDFQNKTVTINKSLATVYDRNKEGERQHKTLRQTKDTKTVSGNRVIPLNAKAIAALRNLKKIYRDLGVKSPNVLVSRNGVVLRNDHLRRTLHRVLKYTTIAKRVTIHQLRHTFATRTLKAGVPITVVSKWLGHSNVSVTYSTYIHALKSQEIEATELLEAI